MQEFSGIIEKYRREGKTAEMLWAFDVYAALEAKSETAALIMGVANNLLYNTPKYASASSIAGYYPGYSGNSSKQLEYMAGAYGMETANPQTFKLGENLGAVGSNAWAVKGIPISDTTIFKSMIERAIDYISGETGGNFISKEASKKLND